MAATQPPIRVLVADDDRGVRAVVRLALKGCAEITIVAEADNGRDALALARGTSLTSLSWAIKCLV